MWSLYDELIEGIPHELTVDALICGANNALVKSGTGYGTGGMLNQNWRSELLPKKSLGMPLRDLAACIKSWNCIEACVGLAAINSYYNEIERVRSLGVNVSPAMKVEDRANDPFISSQNAVRRKKVTIIGHFSYIDKLFAPICDMSIIEKFDPLEGDYPDEAADYLLPESDFVFISSYTLAEKSLPRFLQLAKDAYITVVGPATTLSPVLHRHGVNNLSGFVIKDGQSAVDASIGLGGNIHATGQKVSFRAED